MSAQTPDELFAQIRWGAAYRPVWDREPEAYLNGGLVAPGKSRRLGKLTEPGRAFTAYLGVQDWPGQDGDVAYTRFFASLWRGRRVLLLQTHPTLHGALAQVWEVYLRLPLAR